MTDRNIARHLIDFIDLTDLSEPCTEEAVAALCAKAVGPIGPPAALCLWPQFVGQAQRQIGEAIPVATVINFPQGGDDIERVLEDIDEALGDGADEIDLVFPYRAFIAGDVDLAADMVAAAKERCEGRLLKVILETSAWPSSESLRRAAICALEAGADFLKTSTGKTTTGATEEGARLLLETIRDHGNHAGFKASGGIRTIAQAQLYHDLFETICGVPASKGRFRIGASALFDVLASAASTGTSR
jgi:deoxyribose-phosphate aldolase